MLGNHSIIAKKISTHTHIVMCTHEHTHRFIRLLLNYSNVFTLKTAVHNRSLIIRCELLGVSWSCPFHTILSNWEKIRKLTNRTIYTVHCQARVCVFAFWLFHFYFRFLICRKKLFSTRFSFLAVLFV